MERWRIISKALEIQTCHDCLRKSRLFLPATLAFDSGSAVCPPFSPPPVFPSGYFLFHLVWSTGCSQQSLCSFFLHLLASCFCSLKIYFSAYAYINTGCLVIYFSRTNIYWVLNVCWVPTECKASKVATPNEVPDLRELIAGIGGGSWNGGFSGSGKEANLFSQLLCTRM